MSQFVNVEEGTSGQLPTAHRNGTNTEVSGHIQRGTPDNSGVEVQGVEVRGVEVQGISSSSDRESTRLLHWKKSISKVRPLVNISPFILCVYKISIEPFFLYNTVINYDRKCFEIDEIVSTVDMVLNPFNNFLTIGSYAFLLDAFVVRRVGSLKKVLQGIILFLLLQIGLLDFCFRPNGGHSNFYSTNLFLLQYYLVFILLYIMFTRATRTWATLAKATWAKAAFNLLLYIHGGHVFGGLWYAFAIGKEIGCWKKACQHHASECHSSKFNNFFKCNHDSRDYKFINEFCPTKTRNRTAYDFGIYHDALESGIVEMSNFPKRVLHCFRWGLQNLSGFGQNIQTSTDVWENIFVISITIYGMVLFVIFIGNMQMYLQPQTNRSEMIRQKKREIEQSKSFEKIPEDLQKLIKKYQPEKWEETKGGGEFGNLFNNLPGYLRRKIKRQLLFELLKKVEEFSRWSEELLDELCDCAMAVSYVERAEIVRRGSSIDKMLFLVQGNLQTYSLTSVDTGSAASSPRFKSSVNYLEDGQFCGEELVVWFQADLYSSNLPISTRTIQTIKKVDAFALMSYDLQHVFIKHQTALSTSTQVQAPPPAGSELQAPPPSAEPPAQQPAGGI